MSFKFQSDSINTATTTGGSSVSITFKFQSDSINTAPETAAAGRRIPFKFQSDSINTHSHACFTHVCLTLNSNLILLIRPCW